MTNWIEVEFGRMPTGAVFRLSRVDIGLYIKAEEGALKKGNALVIVARNPDPNLYAQAGEPVTFFKDSRVYMLDPKSPC